jgi:hypothetical protein
MTLSDGYAVMPEQSTVAIVAHHPQAVYFGMKSGFIPEDRAPDELIAGTERGGQLPPESEPEADAPEEGGLGAGAGRRRRWLSGREPRRQADRKMPSHRRGSVPRRRLPVWHVAHG